MTQLRLALEVRRDGRGIALYFKRGTLAVDVLPGFPMRMGNDFPEEGFPAASTCNRELIRLTEGSEAPEI